MGRSTCYLDFVCVALELGVSEMGEGGHKASPYEEGLILK